MSTKRKIVRLRLDGTRRNTQGSGGLKSPVNRLNEAQRAFADFYIETRNATESAIRAGYSPHTAASQGCQLLNNPKIKAYIESRYNIQQQRTDITADGQIIWHYMRSRSQLPSFTKIGPCRHCHGIDHDYQFTSIELREARRAHMLKHQGKRNSPVFDDRGGDGFDPMNNVPCGVTFGYDHNCPACGGVGKVYQTPFDLNKLDKYQKGLFNGVVFKKDGSYEIKWESRHASAVRVEELAGMVRQRVPIKEFDPSRMSEEELEAALQSSIDQGLVQLPPQRGESSSPTTIDQDVTDVDISDEVVEKEDQDA